jgi:hypothetical protein
LEHVDQEQEEHQSYANLPRVGKEIVFFVKIRGKYFVKMYAINISKMLFHVHVDVYLEQEASQVVQMFVENMFRVAFRERERK